MIDKCDSSIATWSENGDNFVVKNIEKFAGVSHRDSIYLLTEHRLYYKISNKVISNGIGGTAIILQTFQFF